MAEGLLKAGADVAIVSSSDTIFSAAEALGQAAGRPVHPIQADLSDRAQLRQAFDEGLEKLGGGWTSSLSITAFNGASPPKTSRSRIGTRFWKST